jgi:hypothetical protein
MSDTMKSSHSSSKMNTTTEAAQAHDAVGISPQQRIRRYSAVSLFAERPRQRPQLQSVDASQELASNPQEPSGWIFKLEPNRAATPEERKNQAPVIRSWLGSTYMRSRL